MAIDQPIILDASTLLVGITKQASDPNYSFSNMCQVYINALFNTFQNIIIHETVWAELDDLRREYIESQFIGSNVVIVGEGDLYGRDPSYTETFNRIAEFDLFKYKRGESLNKGDVYSLAYATHNNIPYLSTRDGSIVKAIEELDCLKNIDVVGFEYILLLGYVSPNNSQPSKRFSSLYKSQCAPAIKAGLIPPTFLEFVKSVKASG